MSIIKTFQTRGDIAIARRAAAYIVEIGAQDFIIRLLLPAKSRAQEERYHAMIGDIAEQFTLYGRRWDKDAMKRLLIDQFRAETLNDPDLSDIWKGFAKLEMCPSIDGARTVILGVQSRKFPKALASAFIEWLFKFGAENGILWSNEMTHVVDDAASNRPGLKLSLQAPHHQPQECEA